MNFRFLAVRYFILLVSFLSSCSLFSQNFSFEGILKTRPAINSKSVEIRSGSDEFLTNPDSTGRFSVKYSDASFLIFGYLGSEKLFGYYCKNNVLTDTIYEGSGLDYLGIVEITTGEQVGFMEEIRPRELALNTSVNGGIENLIKTLGGVVSGNELSTQFSVRGGNFDENSIYVNDIEIYRPQLIQNGQQEGLSFINPHLVDQLRFSAGGFESQFGDKMSSVLDVSYIKPDSFRVQTSLGTMVNSATVEGKSKKLSGFVSVRHFSNSLLTKTLNVDGTYSMNFADIQSFVKWEINKHWSLDFLGNYARNTFQLIPESRITEFGTIQTAYQLNVLMAGQENLKYEYQLGAVTLNYRPNVRSNFKFIGSITKINESENFDVQGAYLLSELDRDLGSENLGKPLRTLGYGYFLDHGRNSMQSRIINFSHLGNIGKSTAKISLKYGVRYNIESISDRYFEWLYNDSSDYNIPPWSYFQDSIILDDVKRSKNTLMSQRISAFTQVKYWLGSKKNLWVNLGVRTSYWNVNKELLIMPRFSVYFEPNKPFNSNKKDSLKKANVTYRFSVGAYHQPPFFRELRAMNGTLNRDLKAQKSYHLVVGMDRIVKLWNKPFKWTSDAYYKHLNELVPYFYDNIRIRYSALNSSEGYAVGFDNRIYGQFNKGLESWFTLSLLQTKERISYTNQNNELVKSDWLRRPTDRRVNFAAIFQDRLPKYPSIRVNLSMILGSSLPYYLDGTARYSKTPSLIPSYRRIDIGFSKTLRKPQDKAIKFKFIKESWISIDVFNLLDINNVIAYSWVKDLNNNRYGVPEYLTGRRLNLRFYFSF